MQSKGIGPGKKEEEPVKKRRGRNYLLAIAIDEYRHAPRLYNCVRDAERMIDVLTEKYQFEREDTLTLFNEEATEANILSELKKLIGRVGPADNLLVIYSGHGEYETEIDEGYWIPVDAEYGDSSDYISNSRITKHIKAIPAHHILFIVDACFSGSLFATRNLGHAATERLDDIASRWLITAGRNEVVSDGAPGDHSPFADNVLYFLEQNTAPSLSVVNLIQHVTQAVAYNARQTPRGEPLQDVGHRGGQFHFYLKGAELQPTPRTDTKHSTVRPPAKSDFRQKYGKRIALAAAGIVLLLALWVVGNQRGFFRGKTGQKTEQWERRLTQTTYDSLLTLGRRAFQQDRFAEARDYFAEALRVAAGSDMDVELARRALAAVDERLHAPTPPVEAPPADTRPADNAGEQADRSEPANTGRNPDERAWQRAQAAGTEDAYRTYLRLFPEGQYAGQARQAIAAQYNYRPVFPFSMGSDQVLNLTLRDGVAPYRVLIGDPKSDRVIEKTFPEKGSYQIPLTAFREAAPGSRLLSIRIMDGNFKTFRSGLPFTGE